MDSATPLRIEPASLPAPSRRQVTARLAQGLASAARHLARRPVPTMGAPRSAAIVRAVFDDLGGTFTKFGQLIASSPGLFGTEVAAEFRGCLDAGPAIPFEDVRAAVEHEFGGRIGDLFSRFDCEPVAAASIAVVHRAALPDGTPVAVKVLRPGIEERIATDLAVMGPLFRFIGRQVAVGTAGALPGLVDGLAVQIAEELDLNNEARALNWAQDVIELLNVTELIVPRPIRSSRRVLVMSFVEGVPIDAPEAIAAMGVDPAPLVRACVLVWFAGLLATGIFHGDIHAGNIFITPEGQMAILDWGIVGRLDASTAKFFRRSVEAVLGDESAWPEVAAHIEQMYGSAIREPLGLTEKQWIAFVRLQVEPLFITPFGQVNLRTMLMGEGTLNAARDGAAAPARRKGLERWRYWREERRRVITVLDSEGFGSEFDRVTFLLGKQLVYFERYGKLFMPDTPLLYDPDAFRSLLLSY